MRKRIRVWVMGATICFLSAAVWAVLAVPDTALAKKPGGGGGGGGGNTAVCVTFADLPGDGVQSDWFDTGATPGENPYCDSKKPKLQAVINADGDLLLTPNNSNNPGSGRHFFVQLDQTVTLSGSTVVFNGTDSLDADLTVTAHDEKLVVVRRSGELDIRDFAVGQSEERGVWVLVFIVQVDGTKTRAAINFDPGLDAALGSTTAGTVTRIDNETWTVEIDGTDTAFLQELYHPTPKRSFLYSHGPVTMPSFTATVTLK